METASGASWAGLSALERRMCEHIAQRQAFLLDDLRCHVAIPTGGNNVPALDETRALLTQRLAKLGASVEIHPGDPRPEWLFGVDASSPNLPTAVCARTSGRASATRILLAGHLDTVHDPHGPFRELSIRPDGQTATGPGCVDMKGGLVILVAALESLEACGVDVAWSVVLNSDEETGTYCSDRHLREQAAKHDVALTVEPALPKGELAIERPGSGQFFVEVRGRSAHVGRAFTEGVSAVNRLAHELLRIADMPDPARGRIINVGPIEGNRAANAVPDRARAWGNVRYPDAQIERELGDMLDALATPPDATPGVRVERSFNRPPKPLTDSVQKLALLAREAAENLGQSLPFAKTGGVCDGNNMQAAGIPVIDTLGVRGGGLHTPDEWIDLRSLVERCQLLALVIARLAEGRLAS
ncbi:MAG: M20/M25/M40 family metallo-hydrolase [Phycisphaerales bacterium]|nr:M20/M25/M40 family metallo-hydrolase [Phycisphaerales bacterium]